MDSLEELSQLVEIYDSQKAIEEKIEKKAIEESSELFCDFEEKLSKGLTIVYSFLSSTYEHFYGSTGFNKNFKEFSVRMNFDSESNKDFEKKGLFEIDTSPSDLKYLGITLQMSPEYTRFIKKRTGSYNFSYISSWGWKGKKRRYNTEDYESEKKDLFNIIKEIKERGELTYNFLIKQESQESSQIFKKMIIALKNLPYCFKEIYQEEIKRKEELRKNPPIVPADTYR